jgi:hypothetical protein
MFIDPTLALLACFAMFAGCSTTAQQNVSTVATNVQTQVKKACGVWGGAVALDAMVLYSFDPKVDLAINSVNALCQANAIVDPSSVQTLAQTTIPAAITALGSVTGVNPDMVKAVGGALTLASIFLNAAVATYVPAVPTGASAPSASQ